MRLPDFSNRNAHIAACSAVSGGGLSGGMDWIVEDIKDRMYFFVPASARFGGGGLPAAESCAIAGAAAAAAAPD